MVIFAESEPEVPRRVVAYEVGERCFLATKARRKNGHDPEWRCW